MRNHVTTSYVIAATIALAGCAETAGSRGVAPVSVALSSARATAASASAMPPSGTPETFTDGSNNTLVISSVEFVVRKVELKQADVAAQSDCPASSSGITASDGGECGGQDEEIEAGPFLVDLPLGGTARMFTAVIPAGTFDALEFEIHRVSDGDAADQAFLAAHPDFAGISLRVQGTFNGADFTFTSDLDVEKELTFDPPVVVQAGVPASLTVQLDLNGWFRNGAGDLVDPATAALGGVNEGLVRDNIVNSVNGFQDNDEDGMDDHREGGDGGH